MKITKFSGNFTPLNEGVLFGIDTEEEIPTVIEKVMLWYKENGFVKERLGQTVDRLGVDALEAALEGDGLLLRRDEILESILYT